MVDHGRCRAVAGQRGQPSQSSCSTAARRWGRHCACALLAAWNRSASASIVEHTLSSPCSTGSRDSASHTLNTAIPEVRLRSPVNIASGEGQLGRSSNVS